jgi:hypothetical protein
MKRLIPETWRGWWRLWAVVAGMACAGLAGAQALPEVAASPQVVSAPAAAMSLAGPVRPQVKPAEPAMAGAGRRDVAGERTVTSKVSLF